MHCNVGRTDCILRIIMGIALIGLTALEVIGPWGWVGILPLITGVMGVCSAYSLFGINTLKK